MIDIKKNTLTPVSENFYGMLWALVNPLFLKNTHNFTAGRKKVKETGEVLLFLDDDRGHYFVGLLDKGTYRNFSEAIRTVQYFETVKKRFSRNPSGIALQAAL